MSTTESSSPQTIAPPLRAVRKALDIGLREAGRRSDIDPAQLSRVERGRASLSIPALIRLARTLGMDELVRTLAPYDITSQDSSDREVGHR